MVTESIDQLEARLRQQFAVIEERLTCVGHAFNVLHPRSADELINDDEFNIDERLPYWAEIWPSARVLAERLSGGFPPHPSPLPRDGGEGERRKRLLELGSGCGYVALVTASLGFDVLATDYYQPACEFVRLNAARHELPNITARLANWREWPDVLGRFDLVVAADVLYDHEYCKLVAGVIARTLAPYGRGIVTDPGRRRAATFLDDCAAMGLTGERIARVPFNNGVDKPTVDVYQLTWK